MITLWGRISSINVQKVVWGLDELGLGYERIDAGGPFGLVDDASYRRMNPNGLVPTIAIDDFVLWESNAILRHLAQLAPGAGLWPTGSRERADADRWMDWQATTATPALRDAFWQIVRTAPAARDAGALTRSVEASARIACLLDRHVAERAYMVGDRFTLADIPVGAHVNRWFLLPIERPDVPHLRAWFERVRSRPGAAQVMALPLS